MSPCILIQNLAEGFDELKGLDRINLAFETKTKISFQSFLLCLVAKTLNYRTTIFVSSDSRCSLCDALRMCSLSSMLDISFNLKYYHLLI